MGRRSTDAYDNALGLREVETSLADTFAAEFPVVTGRMVKILRYPSLRGGIDGYRFAPPILRSDVLLSNLRATSGAPDAARRKQLQPTTRLQDQLPSPATWCNHPITVSRRPK